VPVGDQDAVQALEAQTRLHNLALGAFAAVDQETILIMHDQLSRETPASRGRRSRCTEEDDFEQGEPFCFLNYTKQRNNWTASPRIVIVPRIWVAIFIIQARDCISS